MKKVLPIVVTAILLVLSMNAEALPIDPYTGQGTPILGSQVIATGGDVIATYVSGGGWYDDYLYVSSPSGSHTNSSSTAIGSNWIFSNRSSSSGDVVNLGYFAPGTVLTFNVLADTHLSDFSQNGVGYLNWFTGDASLNADGNAHAFVDSSYTGPYGGTLVGFEDCIPCGGPGYYEDLRYSFTNVRSSVPEPATLSLLGIGLASVGAMRRKKRN